MSPSLKGMKVDFLRSIIRVRASLCAARASSRFLINVFIFSSTVGNFVFSKESGTTIGVFPSINSNGVFGLSACLQSLWVNSRVARE
jgi:hypothetical protein